MRLDHLAENSEGAACDVGCWHDSEEPISGDEVRSWGKTGRVHDALEMKRLIQSCHAPNRRHPIASSRFSGGFLLLMRIDRAASSYQLLNLSLAVLALDRLYLNRRPLEF